MQLTRTPSIAAAIITLCITVACQRASHLSPPAATRCADPRIGG